MTSMLCDNLHANSDTHELKLQGLRLPKTLFYDFKVTLTLECTEFKVTKMSQQEYQRYVECHQFIFAQTSTVP